MEPSCPYSKGQTLVIQRQEQPFEDLNVEAVKTFEPFTLSCALLVELDWPSKALKGLFVLKLFDRRYATQLRKDHQTEDWTFKIEESYRSFIESGKAPAFFVLCAQEIDDEKAWNSAEREAYLQYYCQKHFYCLRSTPRLARQPYSRTGRPHLAPVPVELGLGRPNFSYPGILLEYIQGFSLTDVVESAPRDDWQRICNQAIRTINIIGERDIRNENVKTRSFIIRHDPQTSSFEAVMTDFGHCVLRASDQDNRAWREQKAWQDEEGAIGRVMERKLNGGFRNVPTKESESLLNEFMRE